jgi:hypothetical protein
MIRLSDYPILMFFVSFVVMALSARLGVYIGEHESNWEKEVPDDFSTILAGTLTLLGLIIGFTFSMAMTRYDLRKNYEEAEANAIGTEYFRAGLLSAEDASKVRGLLKSYLAERILFYRSNSGKQLDQVNAMTAQLQDDLWTAVQSSTSAQSGPVVALVFSGMNDVLNSQGYTQAAWWNRIPRAAWALMILIAIGSNALVGFGGRGRLRKSTVYLILPLVLAICFALIADIDTPRGGLIKVKPQNLEALNLQ